MNYKIVDKHIEIEKLGKVKKITGTRLATILNLNAWNTPFSAWCDMTKVYKEPFEDTVYTIAGKVIESKIIKYLNEKVYVDRVVDVEEFYGKTVQGMNYDYWHDEPIFGGMWDALIINKKTRKPKAIIEVKTTKRAEDWADDIPLYYKIQACLYAKLEHVKQVIFAVAFLDDGVYDRLGKYIKDGVVDPAVYSDPDIFIATDKSVKTIVFDLDDAQITADMAEAMAWYEKHVIGKVSPDFDEKKDLAILKELRTNRIESTGTIDDYIAELDAVRPIIEANDAEMKEYTDRLKTAEDGLKKELEGKFTDQDNTVSINSTHYEFRLNRSVKDEVTFNEAKFKKDHADLYKEYTKTTQKITVRKQIKMLDVVSE